MKCRSIPLTQLQVHPKRDNHCSPEVQAKIQRHLERSGNYEPLVVYSDPGSPNLYTIINGHVRYEIAKALGWIKLECYVWDVTPAEAELALATLNTLRGTPDPDKREALLASLAEQFSVEELACLLPESQAMLEDLMALQAISEAENEKAFAEALAAEKESLPVTITFVVTPAGKAIIDEALSQYAHLDAGEALVAICQSQLEGALSHA